MAVFCKDCEFCKIVVNKTFKREWFKKIENSETIYLCRHENLKNRVSGEIGDNCECSDIRWEPKDPFNKEFFCGTKGKWFVQKGSI